VTWEQSGDSLLTSHTDECHGLAGGIQRFSIAPAISPLSHLSSTQSTPSGQGLHLEKNGERERGNKKGI